MGRAETLFFSIVFTFRKKYKYKLRRGVSVCGPEVCAMSGSHCRMRYHGPFVPGFEDVTATPIKPAGRFKYSPACLPVPCSSEQSLLSEAYHCLCDQTCDKCLGTKTVELLKRLICIFLPKDLFLLHPYHRQAVGFVCSCLRNFDFNRWSQRQEKIRVRVQDREI